MVRRAEQGEKGRVKFRIIEFELDGNDATLQESLRSISAAIGRATGGAPVKRVDALAAPARLTPQNDNNLAAVEATEEAPDLEDDGTTAEAGSGTITHSSRQRRPTTYPQPKLLPDIDFSAADVSLKKFMEERKPKSHNMKFMAIVAWFDQHGQVKEITADHAYTVYRAMEWKSRKNMLQPFYFLKQKGWVKQTDIGWTITHIGLDKAKELLVGD